MNPSFDARVGWRFAAAIGFALTSGIAVARTDPDYQRLADQLDRLSTDSVLGPLAPAQLERARDALAQLKDAHRGEHDGLVYLAQRRIDIAQVSAEAVALDAQRDQLQRENAQLQLVQARRDAAQARAELEHQRMQTQIRAEEAERARQDADAARAEGAQAAQAADAARAEADQAKRMAEAQVKATALARKEAELEAAVNGGAATKPSKPKARLKPKTAPKKD